MLYKGETNKKEIFFSTAVRIPPQYYERSHSLLPDINKMTSDEVDVLENCLYYYLLQRESSRSNEFGIGSGAYHALHTPPMEFPLRLSIDQFVVRQVVMASPYHSLYTRTHK